MILQRVAKMVCAAFVAGTMTTLVPHVQAYMGSDFLFDGDTPSVWVPHSVMIPTDVVVWPQRGRSNNDMGPLRPTSDVTEPAEFSDIGLSPEVRIRELFERLAVENEGHYLYSNNSYNEAQIDLRQLVSHSCFNPVGNEIVRCEHLFGDYANLQQALLDGRLRALLVTFNPDVTGDMNALVDAVIARIRSGGLLQQPMEPTQEPERRAQWLKQRSDLLWAICKDKFGSLEAYGCFQRNSRLLRSRLLPLTADSVY